MKMSADKTLEKIIKLEEKSRKLPPLSTKEAADFDTANLIGSVFYSNLLEGNTLPREEATRAMLRGRGRKNAK